MKVVAYCRVSTNKEEQLDSLESQQRFFAEYSLKNGYELVGIYADEGKSGTKMKNRTQLLKLLSDAKKGIFELVLIKDVSRLARNTLDFLTSIRNLKSLGIKVVFINYDQTSSDSSEFMLTMLSAIAQEESANTSKRVKFGKRQNAEHGRVPNMIYGYDKIPGDYFHLYINEEEAFIVKRIFELYTQKKFGANRIAQLLNEEDIRTKRGCQWSQIAISRILTNEIYIGKIINGKQEVEDFLTGKRRNKKEEKWITVHKPELRLIEDDIFYQAQSLMGKRKTAFKQSGIRITDKHTFSQLIICKECGSSFRRLTRTYKNTYISWVCNLRNSSGVKACINSTSVDEMELINALQRYLSFILLSSPDAIRNIKKEINREYLINYDEVHSEKEYVAKRNKLLKEKQKFIEMYTNDIITMQELKSKVGNIHKELEQYLPKQNVILNKNSELNQNRLDSAEEINTIMELLKQYISNNSILKQIIQKIIVDKESNVEIFLSAICEE